MKLEAYTDLVKSNMDVLVANVTMAMETLEDENVTLKDRVFMVEKENMRLQTENRMMKEECNRLKGEVIKLMDTIGKTNKEDDVRIYCAKGDQGEDGCEYACECPHEFDKSDCPDCGCCKDYYKATGVVTNETN